MTMVIGLVGTTIAPWMQFYLQASIVEKGIKIEEYKFARFDVVMGSVVVHVVAFFIILVCAETLFKNGVRIETAKDAALSLEAPGGRILYLPLCFRPLQRIHVLPLRSSPIHDVSHLRRIGLGSRESTRSL